MKSNAYELSLLIEAIQNSLTKEKRKRGECNKITMIPPIRDKTPKDFQDIRGEMT